MSKQYQKQRERWEKKAIAEERVRIINLLDKEFIEVDKGTTQEIASAVYIYKQIIKRKMCKRNDVC